MASAIFSPDGKLIATTSADKTARIWDAATGKPLTPPLNHLDQVTSAAFSRDGKRLVTGGYDDVARVWDVATGTALTPPLPHTGPVYAAAFNPAGTRIATGGNDGVARIWEVQSDDRPVEQLRMLSELTACRRIDETRGLVRLTEEEAQSRWDAYRQKYLKTPQTIPAATQQGR